MTGKRCRWIIYVISIAFYSCKEKYIPQIKDTNVNYLVVEGLIDTGADSTVFSLSRTFKLDGKAVAAPEKAAIVQVESDAGAIYVLPELLKSGNYGRPALNLDQSKKYRLRIRTKDNKEYLSDFVESKPSPPIDDVKFDFRNNYMHVRAGTHDPSGNSRYYRYSYVETWEYETQIQSMLKVENHQILPRKFPEEDTYRCWRTVPSSNISLGFTTNLTEDRLEDKTVISILAKSPKLAIEYSILVKQNVLTKEAFEFFETLQKNTESLGSIFDAQPSQLSGNIWSTSNPSEIVIGFVTAGTTTVKRISIRGGVLPPGYWHPKDSIPVCFEGVENLVFNSPRFGDQVKANLTGPDKPNFIPIEEIYVRGNPNPVGYRATTMKECVDCRLQGGSNIKPSYWN